MTQPEPHKRLFYSGSTILENGLISDVFCTWTPDLETFCVVRKITLRDRIFHSLIMSKIFGHKFYKIRCWLTSWFCMKYEKSYKLNDIPEWYKVKL